MGTNVCTTRMIITRERAPLPPRLGPAQASWTNTVDEAIQVMWHFQRKQGAYKWHPRFWFHNQPEKHNHWTNSGCAIALTTFSISCRYICFSVWYHSMYHGRSASVLHPLTTGSSQTQSKGRRFLSALNWHVSTCCLSVTCSCCLL